MLPLTYCGKKREIDYQIGTRVCETAKTQHFVRTKIQKKLHKLLCTSLTLKYPETLFPCCKGNTSLATVVRRPPPQRPTSPDHLSVDAFAVDDVLLGDDVSKGVGGSGAVSSRSRSTSPARVSRLASAATAPRSAGGDTKVWTLRMSKFFV